MVGKRRHRQNTDNLTVWNNSIEGSNCPLCGRPLIPGPSVDEHHLIPKSKGGTNKEPMHKICHQKIHSLLTETELGRTYNSWEALQAHPELTKFIEWVKKRPPDYLDKNRRHGAKR